MHAVIELLIALLVLYRYLMIARILLSWFPAINWYQQPWRFLDSITEPVLAPFRKLIPPIGGLDLSPIVVFFLIGLLINLLASSGAYL